MSTSTLLAEVLGVFAIGGTGYFVISSSRRSDDSTIDTTDDATTDTTTGTTTAAARLDVKKGGQTEEEQEEQVVTTPLINSTRKQLINNAVSVSSIKYNDMYDITAADINGTSSSSSSPVFTSASKYVPESLKLKPKGDSEQPTLMTSIPQPWEETSVGVSIDVSTDTAEQLPPPSLAQELDWAMAQVLNLGGGCDGVLMVDTRDDAILSHAGPLVDSNTEALLSVGGSGKLPMTGNLEATKVTESHRMGSKMLENPAIKSFAKCRIGQTNVMMVLVSQVDDFLGEREQLVLSSVCQKVETSMAAVAGC